jgi:hypothetical protein
LIGAAQSLNSDTPAHTRSLLASPNIWVELDSTPPLLARERSATQPWRPT